MATISVEGGRPLGGTVTVRGAKNAVLKEMVSSLLAPGRHRLRNVPAIADVDLMGKCARAYRLQGEQGDHELWTVVPETSIRWHPSSWSVR
jgi:UDP-N-acetylglucosamine 1-carboxyvinyltransferase